MIGGHGIEKGFEINEAKFIRSKYKSTGHCESQVLAVSNMAGSMLSNVTPLLFSMSACNVVL